MKILREQIIHRFRLRQVQDQSGPVWFFLPGGPGLGSEYFESLIDVVRLPGSVYLVDFPGDGSNPTPLVPEKWKEGLIELVTSFQRVHLVAHSFAALFVMMCPELEPHLEKLILMSGSAKKITHHKPGPVDLKEYFLSRLHLYVLPETVERAKKLFENLPYNIEAFVWGRDHFHPQFDPIWVPQKLPTLILMGEKDLVTPLSSFTGTPYLQRPNIAFSVIQDASHFPWLEQPEEVNQAIAFFYTG
ncbi:MAG: alpha/beta hydrolase [Verrucomicrobia bacterium]|nr:alpha/beta hydrolase [Verrucomicrobiota bacterium]